MPEARPFPHRILKVRTVAPAHAAPAPARDAIWLDLTPFPPGTIPGFLGSLWCWCDERLAMQAPVLAIRTAPGEPVRTVNLWTSPKFNTRTLPDRSEGWRRIDFTVAFPGTVTDRIAVAARTGQKGGALRETAMGDLVRERGRWRFERKPAPAHPFTRETAGPEARQVICFAGGAPKSGTTWMQILLNQHPDVLSVGEGLFSGIFDFDRPQPANQWYPPNLNPGHLRDLGSELLIHRLFGLMRTTFQCAVAADKTPGNSRLANHLLTIVPEARIIHCVRHPLDVVISRLHHEMSLMNEDGGHNAQLIPDASVLQALAPALAANDTLSLAAPQRWSIVSAILEEWAMFQENVLAAQAMAPDHVLISRYEDMLADGLASATQVFGYLGVSTDPEVIGRCVRAASFDSIKKAELPRENSASFFRKGTARQFEAVMTREDQERAMAFLRQRLPAFPTLGYEVAVAEAA